MAREPNGAGRRVVTVTGMVVTGVVGFCQLLLAPLTGFVFDSCQPGDMPVGCDVTAQYVLFAVPLVSGLCGLTLAMLLPWIAPRPRPRPLLLLPGAAIIVAGFVATQLLSGGRIV